MRGQPVVIPEGLGRVLQIVRTDVLVPGDLDRLELKIAIELRLKQAEGKQLQIRVLGNS